MDAKTLLLQFAFLYAPFYHPPMEQIGFNLYRGPDPSVREIHMLHEKGFKTVVSIRTNSENKKRDLCEKLGMRWVNIKTGVFLLPTDDQFDQFCSVVNDPKNLPCLVSCELGMDRTGIYIAAHRMADEGWTLQKMNDEFRTHHQKCWWPSFRKYQARVAAYVERRREQSAAQTVMGSRDESKLSNPRSAQEACSE